MASDDSPMSFEDTENYRRGAEGVSIKEITLRQFQRCILEGSREMTEGGVLQRYVNGQVIEVAVPNQSEVFIQTVLMLLSIVRPKIKNNDKVVGDKVKKYFDKERAMLSKFKTQKSEIQDNYDRMFKISRSKSSRAAEKNGEIRYLTTRYNKARVENSRHLLLALSDLLASLNYFDEEGMTYDSDTKG